MNKALDERKSLEENKVQVNAIENRFTNLIRILETTLKSHMREIKKENEILDIAERFLYFNKLNQKGQGIKILTRNQMLSGLPISLAQLKAGNSSEKRKIVIRQLFYSLYRSKRLPKNLYKILNDTI